jgi:hypothetical protein
MSMPLPVRGGLIEDQPHLCRDHHVVAERCDRLPENAFGMATAVGIGCVEQPHATFVCGPNSGDRHLVVDLTPTSRGARKLPGATQRPRAGAESGDLPLADSPDDLRRCGARLYRVIHRHSFEVDREKCAVIVDCRRRLLRV